MQKKIVFVLILMSVCVLGITGLQLYWNYQNYKTTVQNFKRDANSALELAIKKENAIRQQEIIVKVKHWLNDTSFINIECNTNNREGNTVFTIQDVHPRFLEDTSRKTKFFEVGLAVFKQKLKKITPAAKAIFIEHFTEKILRPHIEEGSVFYYTQGLGDSIEVAYEKSKPSMANLRALYQKELAQKEIYTSFQLNPKNGTDKGYFQTAKLNTTLRSYKIHLVSASLENPNLYYLKEMKWLIITSLLLIGITLFCFYYTISTLFNQHKLVALKNQFISNMTHEIHTPLASIQITTEALQQFNPDEETRAKYLDIISYQTHKLTMLAKEILASAKLETLELPIKETIDLNELVLKAITDFKLAKNIDLSYVSPNENILIKGNSDHLYRSILNILENAEKYNSTERRVIEVKLSKDQKEASLSIVDNGPGIAPEFKERVFEQFFRIPTGNVHNIKGYGLGLSYVKKVIEQHRGKINLINNQPSGSIFIINLPL